MPITLPTDPLAVLITGATGLAGRAAARRFAADGARLALNGSDRGRLAAMVEELDLPEGRAITVPGDLRDADTARAVVAATEAAFGRVDVLLHLVGGFVMGTEVEHLDHDELRGMLDQHLWTTLNMLQAVVPGMRARGFGRVMAVSSPLADNPGSKGASYAIAKAAEEVLLRSLAREASADGVTANLAIVRTIYEHERGETADAPAKPSWTTPDELADTLAWLASPAAAAVNGVRVALNGRS